MKLKKFLISLVSALSMVLNYQIIYSKGINWLFVDKYFILRLISFIILFILFNILFSKKEKSSKYVKILSIFFSLFLLIGNSYRLFGTIKVIYQPSMIIFILIEYFGFYEILSYLIFAFQKIIKYLRGKNDIKENKIIRTFDSHPFLFSIITLIICWSVYYIAFYPIILSPDPSFQIKQYFNERTKYSDYSIQIDKNINITNHHPVLHTMLLGTSIKIGRVLINDNFGLFIYSFFQGLFMAITLSQTIYSLKKKGIKNQYLFIILAIYSLVPMFPLYAINGNKDVYYSMFIIWLLMSIFDLIYFGEKEKMSLKKGLSWLTILLFICLFRNNGIYLVCLLFPCILIFSRVNLKKFIAIFTIVITLFFSYEKLLLPSLGITGGSIRESLSIFFQQTARYVVNHEEELSKEDKEVIGNILNYAIIKKKYNPVLADPIKNTYNKYATTDDLKAYFKFWIKGFFKHPITYVDATLNNIYGYFDPGDINWYIYTKFDSRITQNNLVNYHYNNLGALRNVLSAYGATFIYLPFIGLISNIGFANWLLIAMGLWIILQKKYKYLLTLVPMYISVLVCMASPVNTYFRYAMPYVFAMPFLIGTWFLIYKKN